MIRVSEAAKKYGLTYSLVLGWVNSGYVNAVPMYPGTKHRDQAIEWREEHVLEAMALLYKAGVKTATAVFLARGSSPHIRELERALDKCKYIRASGVSQSSGGQ